MSIGALPKGSRSAETSRVGSQPAERVLQSIEGAALSRLAPFLEPGATIRNEGGILTTPLGEPSVGMKANAYYFSHPRWTRSWLTSCHRYPEFVERWRAATGSWDGKIVVDIGCGPGNLYASVGGSPSLLIGVDIARGSLMLAAENGYVPLLADAHHLPFKSGFADIVTLSATLHHCDHMPRVLAEAARLVRFGGILVSDHDPQRSAHAFNGLGLSMWKLRVPLYRLMKRGGHSPDDDEQAWALATEIHHRPGDGVTPELFEDTLRPLGFKVDLYPHNNLVGADIFKGGRGRSFLAFRSAQRLSGIDPDVLTGAMTLMCVAARTEPTG